MWERSGGKQIREMGKESESLLTPGDGACHYSPGRGKREVVNRGGRGLFMSEDVFPQMRRIHVAVREHACYVFPCNLHKQIPLQPKQQRIEKEKEKPSLSKSNFSWKAGGQRGGGGGGGAERRRRRRCNLSEGLQGVLAEHDCRLGACSCVGVCAVTSPSREFTAKQHQRHCSVTELEQEIKNSPERQR